MSVVRRRCWRVPAVAAAVVVVVVSVVVVAVVVAAAVAADVDAAGSDVWDRSKEVAGGTSSLGLSTSFWFWFCFCFNSVKQIGRRSFLYCSF